MKPARFLTEVEECLGGGAPPGMLAVDEAARTTRTVLRVVARQLSLAERQQLQRELPEGLGAALATLEASCGSLSLGDTVGLVACELSVDAPTAERRLCCVLSTVRQAVGHPLPGDLEMHASAHAHRGGIDPGGRRA
jgi:hypothetical protein